MAGKYDWATIKTEYITKGTPYRELSKKYGPDLSTIGRRASKEGWEELRKRHENEVQTKAEKKIAKKKVDRASKILDTADMLLEKMREYLEQKPPERMNTQEFRHLSGTIKDLEDIFMIRSDADMREQEARIEKLRKEAQREDGSNTPTLVVEGLPEEFKV